MNLRTTLLAAAATIGLMSAANAVPITAGSKIDLNGFVQATGSTTLQAATGLDFTTAAANTAGTGTPGPGVLSSYGGGTGTFAGLTCSTGSCGSIQDIASLVTGAQTITNFVSLSGGTNPNAVNFTLRSIDSIGRGQPNFLTFTASGTITYDGFDATPGTFLFSAQGDRITSFSGTTISAGSVATPEPASLAILSGSLAALGLVRRRKA